MAGLYLEGSVTGPPALDWLLIPIAVAAVVVIIYLIGRIGPGGPWATH
jgi:hypothetical protein